MSRAESTIMEGTPAELAERLHGLEGQRRYRLIELGHGEAGEVSNGFAGDPNANPTIALLESWIASAPTNPEAVREAEEDLRETKCALNRTRKEAGARVLFPEEERA